MSIYKRGNKWWAQFGVDGKVYRVSLNTTDRVVAKGLEKQMAAQALEGKVATGNAFAKLPFSLAIEQYRRDRLPNLSKTTQRSELDHAKPLVDYFRDKTVAKIDEPDVRDYIAARHEAELANSSINKELGVLMGVLKRAKRSHLFVADVRRLKTSDRQKPGRALENDEKLRLVAASKSNPRWHRARLAMTLALNTTARTGELRGLRWRDVNWIDRMILINGTKTPGSRREVPLNRDAYAALQELRQESINAFGDAAPDACVFYAIKYLDANRPQTAWKGAWKQLTKAAGLSGLRFHDLRHHAITELSESQASDSTIMAIAGHVTREMMKHYSHVRKDARREALDRLCGDQKFDPKFPDGSGSQFTSQPSSQAASNSTQAEENIGENVDAPN